MTDEDTELVLVEVRNAEQENINITHGTDSMVETGRLLSGVGGKTIVLTGALSPALFKNSDAMFNIGAALTAVQSMPHGVYIAMNGVVFEYDKVRKNIELNRFVNL